MQSLVGSLLFNAHQEKCACISKISITVKRVVRQHCTSHIYGPDMTVLPGCLSYWHGGEGIIGWSFLFAMSPRQMHPAPDGPWNAITVPGMAGRILEDC